MKHTCRAGTSRAAAAFIAKMLIANRYDDDLGADGVAEVASIALDALTAAGYVLLPPDDKIHHEWGAELVIPGHRNAAIECEDRAHAEHVAATHQPLPPVAVGGVVRREIRTWPDGSQWTGPWTAVEPSAG